MLSLRMSSSENRFPLFRDMRWSLRLHAGLLDDGEILVAFRLHEGGELIDRQRGHVGTFIPQPRPEIGLRDDLVDLGIDPRDHLLWRSTRREDALPETEVEIGEPGRLRDGRHIGRRRRTLGGRYRKQLQRAGLDLRYPRRKSRKEEIDVPAQEIV